VGRRQNGPLADAGLRQVIAEILLQWQEKVVDGQQDRLVLAADPKRRKRESPSARWPRSFARGGFTTRQRQTGLQERRAASRS